MARVKTGPLGEALFPKAELDLEMEGMLRYRTEAPFEEIAAFYDAQYEGRKEVQRIRAEHEGHPVFTVGVGPRATDLKFAALVVMIDRQSLKKRKPAWHILVTAR